MIRILFVCLGNICRSPAAEGVFRHLAQEANLQVHTDSAGTSAWHEGEPPNADMLAIGQAAGYDFADLTARQVLPTDFEKFDMILAMDHDNLQALEEIRPEDNFTPLQLFMDYAKEDLGEIVPDPYYSKTFQNALNLIESASKGLVAHIKSA